MKEPQKQQESAKYPLYACIGMILAWICLFALVFVTIERNIKNWRREAEQARIDFRHIPPEWIAFQQTGIFAVPVEGQATSFAVMGEEFVIGTANPHALAFVDMSGTLLRQIELHEEPRAIALGTADTIFTDRIIIAHSQHLAVYNAQGQIETTLPLPRGHESNVRSLVVTPNYLFVADTFTRQILRFDSDGNHDLTFAPDDGFIVFVSPIVMTYSPHTDLLYIANPGRHRVDVFTQDGEYKPELIWGEAAQTLSGFVGCCNPIGLATLDDGRIMTVEKAASRVKIFRDGELDSVVAGWSTLENIPREFGRLPMQPSGRDFAAMPLPSGRIAVFDFNYKALRIFEPAVP